MLLRSLKFWKTRIFKHYPCCVMYNPYLKPGSINQNGTPFICRLIPFVCSNDPVIYPFIGKKIPYVCLGEKNGFSLVELLVAITVIAILGTIAAPEFLNFVRDNRLTTTTNELISDMLLARNEAIKRNTPVVICKTADAIAANPVCDGTAANAWTSGWIVFVDTNDLGTRDSPGGTLETLIRVHGTLQTTMTLTPRAPDVGDSDIRNNISFRPSGRLLNFTGGTFKLCDQRGANSAKSIIISETGQARVSGQRDSSGPLWDHKNGVIACP